MDRNGAETVAIGALGFIASDPERLGRLLSITGLDPESIRAAAGDRHFLAGILEHVASDESLLRAFATDSGIEPRLVDQARAALAHRNWEREVP